MKKICIFILIILLAISCSTTNVGITEKQLSDLKQSKWTELSTEYDSSYFEGKKQEELSSETLAEWRTILEDDTLTELITLSNDNKNLDSFFSLFFKISIHKQHSQLLAFRLDVIKEIVG